MPSLVGSEMCIRDSPFFSLFMEQKYSSHNVIISFVDWQLLQKSKIFQEFQEQKAIQKQFLGVLANYSPILKLNSQSKIVIDATYNPGSSFLSTNLSIPYDTFCTWLKAKDQKFAENFISTKINYQDSIQIGTEKLIMSSANLPTKYKKKYDNENQYYYQFTVLSSDLQNYTFVESDLENVKLLIKETFGYYSGLDIQLAEFQLLKLTQQLPANNQPLLQQLLTELVSNSNQKLKQQSDLTEKQLQNQFNNFKLATLNICNDFRQEKILMLPTYDMKSGFFDDKQLQKYVYQQ
eukprot:TRINITY_DN5140_c0_g1_i2.p1 TRINITY_DN5140_c0_g1~~TRINITY_DN5140_c0_g1_i2.p1  ORF type:complete len:293 (+),score=63.19 TRINITY_DN5140_c0_g1_i2:67-945(+)